MQALVFGYLFSFARRTVTQALVALGRVAVGVTDSDWSGFYRLFSEPRIDYEVLTRCFLREALEHVAPGDPYVVVVDGVQITRHPSIVPSVVIERYAEGLEAPLSSTLTKNASKK
ncbi:hypothetical protein BH24ACT20_BH24ACT20_00680 [soil metagenome]|jgi:hypothetical protein